MTKLCSRTFLSFTPLAFTHFPPDTTTSKLCEDSIFGNSACTVYKMYGFILVKKLATFGYFVGVSFFHGNLSVFSENFKLASQRITRGKVLGMSPWTVRGRSAEGTT